MREIKCDRPDERVFVDNQTNKLVVRVRPIDDEKDQIIAFDLYFDGHALSYNSEYDRRNGYKFSWKSYDPKSHTVGPPKGDIDLQKVKHVLEGEDFSDIKQFVWKRASYLKRFLKANFFVRPIIYLFEPF